MRSFTLVIALLFAPALAHADDADRPSPDVALALSAGGAVASIGLVAAGTVALEKQHSFGWAGIAAAFVAPSAGELYAGSYVTIGLGARLTGAAIAGYGIAASFCNDSSCSSDFGHALIGLGIATAASGIVYDVVSARSVARRHSTLVPTVQPSANGPVVGIALAGAL